MIQRRDDAAKEAALKVARSMVAAALTAPKAHGVDDVDAVIIEGEEKDILANHMRDICEETGEEFYGRDANNVDASHCVVIVAAKDMCMALDHCNLCGLETCAGNRKAGAACALNMTNLGIAVGSAVALAADNRIDTRVMFSAGKGAMRMNIFGDNVKVCYGLPLSTTSKSIFFDRNPGAVLIGAEEE